MGKNNVDKLNRRSAYFAHLETVEQNPRLQKRANKLARKAQSMSRKSYVKYNED